MCYYIGTGRNTAFSSQVRRPWRRSAWVMACYIISPFQCIGIAISSFTITNGGYTNCFSSQPTIILTGGGGYATTTCTLTNGVITAIANPIVGNNFTSAPSVSVLGGGLPTKEQIADYMAGYYWNEQFGDRKDWG